nr:TGB2 [Garlic virus C]
MSFTPPPDNTKVYLTLAIGAAAGILIYTLRTNQLAHVGDNTHHLPHGGRYCDGNKRIHYNGPQTGSYHIPSFLPFVAAIALTVVIHFLSCNRRRVCVRCSESH